MIVIILGAKIINNLQIRKKSNSFFVWLVKYVIKMNQGTVRTAFYAEFQTLIDI